MSTRRKVFFSYAHEDERLRTEILPFVAHLDRESVIEWWDDHRIRSGAHWEREIDESLQICAIAVLLVTENFTASDFIWKRELPRLLAREARGEIRIIPILWRPSAVADVDVTFEDAAGATIRKPLTEFQCVGQPDRTLSDMRENKRGHLLTSLARALQEGTTRLDLPFAEGVEAPSARISSPSRSGADADLAVLVVRLAVEGDQLVRTYTTGRGDRRSTNRASWSLFEPHLREIHAALDGTGAETIEARCHRRAEMGGRLFSALLGEPPEWGPVLRMAFAVDRGPQPNPTFRRLRVRIETAGTQSLLRALPWRATCWEGLFLIEAGWTFEQTLDTGTLSTESTPVPFSVVALALAGTADEKQRALDHLRDLEANLRGYWGDGQNTPRVRIADSRRSLSEAFEVERPVLIYAYGRAEAHDGAMHVVFLEDGARHTLPLSDLVHRIPRQPRGPQVVYFNTGFAPGNSRSWRGMLSPDDALGGDVPLVLWRRLPQLHDEARVVALDWLRNWIDNSLDPVQALHRVTQRFPHDPEANCLVITARYRDWVLSKRRIRVDRGKLEHLLDRTQQKALTAKYVKDLVWSPTRRVLALIGFGVRNEQADAGVDHLPEQLIAYLERDAAESVAIKRVVIQFPTGRSTLRSDLEHELRLQLNAEQQEATQTLLRRWGPRALPAGQRGVLWLDWGVIAAASFSEEDQEVWVRFCSEHVALHCPDGLSIVMSLGLVASTKRVASDLQKRLKELRAHAWTGGEQFAVRVLPQVGDLPHDELQEFLEDGANTSCPAELSYEIADRLIARTGGDFAQTLQLLKEAEDTSWYDLRDSLRREQERAD